MTIRIRLATALFALTSVVAIACTPETVQVSPAPTTAPSTAVPATAAPTRTATPAPTTPAPTAAPTAPATSTASTSPQACAPLAGGSPLAGPTLLTAIRAAHQPGFDRVVFEFSSAAVPQYRVEPVNNFATPGGLAIRVDGNAFFSVRFAGRTQNDAGQRSYAQPDPYRVGLVVVREIKYVDAFEGQTTFGLGMERPICPTVLTLLGPSRIAIDFPTPP